MSDINVLILSAGRRVELVESFKSAQLELNMSNAKVIGVDISRYAPALFFADKYYIIPRIEDNEYLNTIISISNNEDIRLIVPTIDTELYKLAKNKELIESKTNAKVLVSNLSCIDICNNKLKTIEFLQQNNFRVPKTYSIKELEEKAYAYPLFIKPCYGSSSKDTFIIKNESELSFFKNYVDNAIIQEMIIGQEYSVDVCLDFVGNVISIVPRARISTRGGEILQGRIDKNRVIIEDIKRLMNILRPIGHITVQCFLVMGEVYYIEINPRFGGGAPMSFYAGAKSPKFLLQMMNGEKLDYYEGYKDQMVFSRFDSCIEVE